jgi:hypothetical protein
MRLRRLHAALTVSLVLLAPAGARAQDDRNYLVSPPEAPPPGRASLPSFRISRGDLREIGVPPRSGLIGAVPLGPNLRLGIGRFRIPEIARPRTHMEAERAPTDLRRRERGIAAIGLSFSF